MTILDRASGSLRLELSLLALLATILTLPASAAPDAGGSPMARRAAQLELSTRDTERRLASYIETGEACTEMVEGAVACFQRDSFVRAALEDLVAELAELGLLRARLAGEAATLAGQARAKAAALGEAIERICRPDDGQWIVCKLLERHR